MKEENAISTMFGASCIDENQRWYWSNAGICWVV